MIANKNERKYFGVLRRLAKLDNSIFNTLKVTVCEGEFNEEKECFFVAPLMIFYPGINIKSQKSSQILVKKMIENSNDQTGVSNEDKIEISDNYPDSSDFSDDE